MSPDAQRSPVGELAEKEQWARSTAAWIVEEVETRVGPIDYETALKASRFANIWVDEFKELTEGHGDSSGDPKAVMDRARQKALAKTEGIDRYPTGVPSLKTIMASWYAFSLAFGDEASQVFQLLVGSGPD